MYSRASTITDKILNFVGFIMKPPKIATVNLEEVDADSLSLVEPVFVLSTGRCGTRWLTELLRKDSRMRVNHDDYPELLRESRLAYEGYFRNPQLFKEILRATRDGYLLDAYRRNQHYVETNHRITFLSYAIQAAYPKSRFIHVYRHPGDFVRSGIRRHWYRGTYNDICRPRIADQPAWDAMSAIEKLAWLWNETNEYIEGFIQTIDSSGSYLQVKCEDMFEDVEAGLRICEFTGATISADAIALMQKQRVNRQRTGLMQRYDRWSDAEKGQLRKFAPLAARYGYDT